MERLQKFIAQTGYCSRRKAEELIINKKVYVNNVLTTELGTKVKPGDDVVIEGIKLEKEDKEYYIFNKPRSIISSTKDDKNRKTVIDFFNTKKRLFLVGRLDYDTTGLILVTNDGEFANMLMHPKNEIEKVYVAKINGIMKKEEIVKFKRGMFIDNVRCKPDKVKVKKVDKKSNSSIVEITLHEGKNHEIKKMFENIGYEVLKLKRERFAFLDLGTLKSGEYRKLQIKEIKILHSLIKK